MNKRVQLSDLLCVGRGSSGSWMAASFLLALGSLSCTDDDKGPNVQPDASVADGGAASGDGGLDARADAQAGLDASADAEASVPVEAAVGDGSVVPIDAGPGVEDTGVEAGDAVDGASPSDAAAGGVGAPAFTTAQARQVGRFGGDLRIDVTAVRGERTIVAVDVQLLNGQRASVGASRTIPLEEVISSLSGSSFAVLDGTFERFSEVSTARVSLLDEVGFSSTPQELTVTRQAVVEAGAACDDTFVTNRCAASLGCKAPAPNTCQAGVAPVLTRLGYFADELGARVVFEGTDADADVVGYRMQFLDTNGDPVSINHDSDDSSPPVSVVTGAIAAQTGTTFFLRLAPSEVLVQSVASVRVNAVDSADRPSNSLVAERDEAPTRGLGASCDERSFNRCSDGGSCTDFGDQHRCALPTEAQQSSCSAALVLNPSTGSTRVRGSLRSSLWEPPSGCSFGQAQQPDRVVKLVLTEAATKLTLSTDHPYTGFDTELYLLTSCSAAPTLSWCVADQTTPTTDVHAVLTLQNVAAGEYYVVVDSFPSPAFDATSDTFELTATVE